MATRPSSPSARSGSLRALAPTVSPRAMPRPLRSSPTMGFYAPAQLVRDAERHGVEVRPPDINHSRWDCTLEQTDGGRFAVRLGLRMARGLANRDGALIVAARHENAFAAVEELWRRAGVPVAALERLAEADAFGSLGLTRRQALWDVRA